MHIPFFIPMDSIGIAIFSITFFCNAILVITVVSYKRAASFQMPTIAFSASVLFLLAWTCVNFFADISNQENQALTFTRMTFPFAVAMGVSFLAFSLHFPSRIKSGLVLLFIFATAGVIVSVEPLSEHIIKHITLIPGRGVTSVELGNWYPFYLSYAVFLLGSIILSLIAQYHRADKASKRQLRIIASGMSIFFFGSIGTNLILPYFTGHALWSKFGPLFSIAIVGCVTYAIIYHHFLDIRVIIQRGFIYTILASAVFAAYFSLVSLSGFLFGEMTEIGFFLSGALSAVFGALSAKPIERYLREKTDHFFFKDRYDIGDALREIGDIAKKNLTRQQVTEETASTLKRTLRAKWVILATSGSQEEDGIGKYETAFLNSNHKIVSCSESGCYAVHIAKSRAVVTSTALPGTEFLNKNHEVSIIVPLRNNDETIGNILVGPKRSGERYVSDDFRFLSSAASYTTAALEKARLYEEEREHLRTLEEKVLERTQELRVLQQTQRETMIDIAHNLQSPFTAVKGTLDLIRPQSEDQKKNLAAAKRSVDRVTKFVYDLLALARFDALHKETPTDRIDLRSVLFDLVEEYRIITAEEDVTIALSAPETPCLVLGNRHLLEQLFGNILSNAVKYRRQGTSLSVAVTILSDENRMTVSISDTGIGISEDALPHIFGRYRRAGEPALVHGSGLGLAIVEKIARFHDAEVSVQSVLGKGSSFSVQFKKNAPEQYRTRYNTGRESEF